jgi:RHS repeat-associated protein
MLGDKKESVTGGGQVPSPAISLPKGGGAIRSMGEKFAANPVTGTGSFTVPIATSPGRSGFGPQLSLSYDSGAGNGPFGLGWNLTLPAITRKTDKGLPRYRDADEFVLSGAEDLVPVLVESNGQWQAKALPPRTVDGKSYRIQRYRPRIEGLFARIERWTNVEYARDSFWRSISRDNVTTWYGKTAESRIADPADPARIFSWLICESYDDKGNVIVYRYKPEDSNNVDLSQVHEANRTDTSRSANRYLKRIRYGNHAPFLPVLSEANPWPLPSGATAPDAAKNWFFELVFDYEDHDADTPVSTEITPWSVRHDPFSSYRAGFEVRTYRLCQRVLMFHHFPGEEGVGVNCLVRSTDFTYRYEQDSEDPRNPIHSVLTSVSQCGYKRQADGYLKRSLPPLEFEYSEAKIHDEVNEVDSESLENLPYGLDNKLYQWVDLDGEGLSGILSQQGRGWFYKTNLSPLNVRKENGEQILIARFGSLERVTEQPSLAALASGGQQLLDLAGDGQLDLVELDRPTPGFYERTHDERWETFRPFTSVPNLDWDNPNLRFVDLTGDGHADIFISEDDAFCWHPSLAEAGFGPPELVRKALDEENGPRVVFADGTQSIYLADISGDGLTDLVRIRNGDVCYWPNMGYGHFGAKVTMDNAPWFDATDQFDQRRIRLADIDGSGVTDILYLGRDGVSIYYNQSGNSWSDARTLAGFPHIDNLSAVAALDLLGNGTACLVWSSPLSGDAQQAMRYFDLMGGQKPHLLVKSVNNLGAETHVHYAPSTRFYLEDKLAGHPWVTRLPFPVHVVERVDNYDYVSRNRFVTRYAYHHGYFDGEEREFRGFGRVDQWDTEEFAALTDTGDLAEITNIDSTSHVPPVLTKTWFHTGTYVGRNHVSNFFAGLLDQKDLGEYYREPGLSDEQAKKLLLDDTVLPGELTVDEEGEACRALKGAMLRQEVYALDGTDKQDHPYAVTEQNFTIKQLQPEAGNRHAVFFTHPREAINYHYERNPEDPRIAHALTLEVDDYGNVLKEAVIGYGRRPGLSPLQGDDKQKQEQSLITYTKNEVSNPIDAAINDSDNCRTPLPSETRTYEVTGFKPANNADRFSFDEWVKNDFALIESATEIAYEEVADLTQKQMRLIEHIRTLYRKDDLTAFSPLGEVEPLALPGESYKLAFTPGLLAKVYKRGQENLLPSPATVLNGDGGYVDLDGNGNWWIPSGRVFFHHDANASPAQELAYAQQHFFLPHRFRDPFGNSSLVSYDKDANSKEYDLLVSASHDALGNEVKAEHDYRMLQPHLVTDPNGNRSEVAFDALGFVVGTAAMGKPGENLGDSLTGFPADLDDITIVAHIQNPLVNPYDILKKGTTRLVYDLAAYQRTKDGPQPQPVVVYTMVRETHDADLESNQQTTIQHGFSYSDGFDLEIQKKIRAEPGPVEEGGPMVDPRWVGSGWTIFNNKGKLVRQYEPFFSGSHEYCIEQHGVSPTLFYDPVERVVATLHPNHTYDKVVFDPWQQETWDVNDTVLIHDPGNDPDVGGFFQHLSTHDYLPTWYALRSDPTHAAAAIQKWPDPKVRNGEQSAAAKAFVHDGTPTVSHFDTLGRPFLTVAHNRLIDNGNPVDEKYSTRVDLDIEGNQREVIDAKGRVVMRYDYDMLGNRIFQASMDAGDRWMLNDVAGNPIHAWNSRECGFRTAYDPLRRPIESYMRESAGTELLVRRTVYGETRPNPETKNLRGQVVQLFDQAGVVTSDDYDFKGNLLSSARQLAQGYKTTSDWLDAVPLEAETYTSRTRYDALNRPIQLIAPHSDLPGTKINVIQPVYNEANLLERVQAWLNQNAEPAEVLDPVTANLNAISDIDYDSKGQRTLIEYGNGAITTYVYEKDTFRLIHLKTTRQPGLNGMASQIFDDPQVVQDLGYTYDPAGNITRIEDAALSTITYDNGLIEPVCSYTYDALYRLIEAKGREHIGQNTFQPSFPNGDFRDYPFTGLNGNPNDLHALHNYTEQYDYDPVGNINKLIHQVGSGAWTRDYDYDEASILEPATKKSNRLSATTVRQMTEAYSYDVHGNMTKMPHLAQLKWNFNDQSHEVDLGGGGKAYYVYDAGGQRGRKVLEKNNGSLIEERVYLGGFEVYRKRQSGSIELERETLHIMDDQQRIVLVETKTVDNQNPMPNPQFLLRYQLGNHLGSASLELDDAGAVISYEEYHPYGTTSYQAGPNAAEVSVKRYRYAGKERDVETGLYYYGARYYACWLGRWTSADPAGLGDGTGLYNYVRGSPVVMLDANGREALPSPGAVDYEVMTKTDSQLRAHLAGMSPEARASFASKASGRFATRTWATLNRAGMTVGYHLPEARISGRAPIPKNVEATQPDTPPLENVKHAEPWTPRGIIREGWEYAIDTAANPDNPWYVRAAGFAGAIAGFGPTAGEMIVHGVIATPQLAVTETIAAGEHAARAYLLYEQGFNEAALDEVLASGQAGAEGVAATADTVGLVGGGVDKARAAIAQFKADIAALRNGINAVATEGMAGVPVIRGKPQVTSPGHAERSVEAAKEAFLTGDQAINYHSSYKTATGQTGKHMNRLPDVLIESGEETFLSIEVLSKYDTGKRFLSLVARNLKAMLRLGGKSEGLVITKPK